MNTNALTTSGILNSIKSQKTLLRKMRTPLAALSVFLVMIMSTLYLASASSAGSNPGGSLPGAAPLSVAGGAKKAATARATAGKRAKEPVRGSSGLNIERRGHTATRLADGRVLIVGGENDRGAVQQAEVFDRASRAFTLSARLSNSRTDHTATRLADGRVLIAGGRNGAALVGKSEIFDPATGAFSEGPSLGRGRAGHTATLLADGRVFIAGGDSEASAEIFDPATGRFSLIVGRMGTGREKHSAVLLKSGKVLIAGGLSVDGKAVQYGEVFDPETMQFSKTRNPMKGTRTTPALKVLPDGKVQVIGGDDERSMEMFNAEGGYFTAYARLASGEATQTDISAALSTESRAALIHKSDRGSLSLEGIRSTVIDGLLSHRGTIGELLDRGGHTVTDMPEAGQAIVVGGISSEGIVLSSVATVNSSTATVTTDLTDYQPGMTVVITGTGWLPGETVELRLHRDEQDPSTDTILSAVADTEGNIQNSDYVCQETDLGVTFLLTATGQTSGYTAQTTFTDGNPQVPTVLVGQNPNPVSAGNSATYTIRVTFDGNAVPCTVILSATPTSSPAWPLPPPGGFFSFSPPSLTGSNTTGGTPRDSVLTVTTPAGMAPNTYQFTVTTTSGEECQGPATRTSDPINLIVASANVAPEITCPSDITVDNSSSACSASVPFTTTVTGTPTPTVECKIGTDTITSPHIFPVGTTTVTCTATNTAGTDSCSFNVTVNDITPPNAVCQDITVYLDGSGNAVVNASQINNGSTDNCAVTDLLIDGQESKTFTCANAGPNTVTLTVKDAAGNSSNCTATVTVVDNTNPTAVCQNITVYLDATGSVTVNATAIDNGSSDNCGITERLIDGAANKSFTCANLGANTVTLTVKDAAGNSSTCSATVTVADEIAPAAVCKNISVNLSDTSPASVIVNALDIDNGSSDNCGVTDYEISKDGMGYSDSVSFDCSHTGPQMVTLRVKDASGNSATCTATVTVVDNTPPTISCPSEQTLNLDGSCSATVPDYTSLASTGDNCSTSITVTQSPAPGSSVNGVGSFSVTLTADDGNDNTNSCSFTVNKVDVTPPSISCPGDITRGTDPGQCSAVVTFTVTANDNCDGPLTPTCMPASGSVFPKGTTSVTCTATDNSGRTNSCTFNVQVNDTEKPTINCPSDIMTALPPNSSDTSIPVSYMVTANDNCDGSLTPTCTPPSGSIFGVGTTQVNCTVSDVAGNTKTCGFAVIVCYNFTGFFRPIDNLPVTNVAKAGSAIPVKFSLSGFKGFDIFAPNYPKWIQVGCDDWAPSDTVDETVTAGGSSLNYDPTTDQYIYVWKTEKPWSNSCRQLVVKLKDGKEYRANFKFNK